MPVDERAIQLIDPIEIKQESIIKEEPKTLFDLIEFPALNLCHTTTIVHLYEFGNKENFTQSTNEGVKIEVKEDISGRIKNVTKPNGAIARVKPRIGKATAQKANESTKTNEKIKRLNQHPEYIMG